MVSYESRCKEEQPNSLGPNVVPNAMEIPPHKCRSEYHFCQLSIRHPPTGGAEQPLPAAHLLGLELMAAAFGTPHVLALLARTLAGNLGAQAATSA